MNESSVDLTKIVSETTSQIISTIDPNWFYSSLAQSSAAIVGIIGAFFTTRVINQRIQINQLNREIKDKKSKIKFLEESIIEKEKYIQRIDEEDNLNDAKEFLEEIKDEIDLDNPLKIADIIQKGNEYDDDSFHNLSKEALTKVYPLFLDKLKNERKVQKGFLSGLSFNLNPTMISALPNIKKYDTYNKYYDEISNVKLEINYLSYEIRNKEEDISVLKKGMPLISTLLVLFGFSLIGVFLPIFILTQSPEIMEIWKIKTFFIVFLAWISLIIFFLMEILMVKYNWWKK